ncbi:MAG TPA: carboxypeptidase regulatory-like domain-containing protein [Planctomycetota bacterium]|nr:carboxypeptidase regulatory-like domain-containing protein [Planctomycetota bacterium]
MKAGTAALLGAMLGAAATLVVVGMLGEVASESVRQGTTAGLRTAPEASFALAPRAEPSEPRQPSLLAARADRSPLVAPASAALDARVGLLVYGAVTEPSGAPVHADYMGIRFVSADGDQHHADLKDDATYSVTGLKPGAWTVTAGMVGYRPTSATLDLDASRPVTRLDLIVEPAVRLVVSAFTPDGLPLMETLREQAGAKKGWWNLRLSALASVEPLGELRPQFERGWDFFGVGRFIDRFEAVGTLERKVAALPPGALGWLDLSVSPPVYVTLAMRNAVLASQRVEPEQGEVVFHVALDAVSAAYASLTARFVDALTRLPLESVTLDLFDSQLAGTPQSKSDGNGLIRCEKLLPGGLRFEVEREGYEHLVANISLDAGEHADLGDVALAPATTLSGTVLDEEGHPIVAGVRVSVVDSSGPLTWDYSAWGYQSKGDGTFTIEHLGRRRYALRIADDERASVPVFVDAQAGDVSGIVLRAETGQSVSVRLDWPVTEQRGMRVRNTDGLSWTDWDGWSGQYVWKRRMPRGAYVAECYEGASVLQSLPFEVADAPVALTLTGK